MLAVSRYPTALRGVTGCRDPAAGRSQTGTLQPRRHPCVETMHRGCIWNDRRRFRARGKGASSSKAWQIDEGEHAARSET